MVELGFEVLRKVVEQVGREAGETVSVCKSVEAGEECVREQHSSSVPLTEDLRVLLGKQTWDNPTMVLEDGIQFSWQEKRG